MNNRMMLLALSGNLPLAQKIAKQMKIDLSEMSIERFSDGEIRLNIAESVRGANVFVIQSTSNPVNDNLMELLMTIDALRRASANQVNVVIPYFGYARQDRKSRSREPITARLVADLLERAGASRIVAMDLHASQIQGFFDIPLDHLEGGVLLADYLLTEKIVEPNSDDFVIVSPDHGGVTRARNLANFLGLTEAPMAVIDKKRSTDKKNTVEIMNVIGDVEGKNAIMIDDMIDTGGTIVKGAQALKERGANKIYVVASHAVLSGDAPKTLQESAFEKVILLDTIAIPDQKKFDKLVQVSTDQLFARTINYIQEEKSVSPLFSNRFERK